MRQGLTLGVNAIELARSDDWKYDGLKTGNKVELAAAISSASSWTSLYTYSAPMGFTVYSPLSASPALQHVRAHRQLSTSFTVVGPCTVNGACARSPNYPSKYGSSQSCTITPTSLAVVQLLSTTAFNTESCCDKLIVNGATYSGTIGPSNVLLGSASFTWSSDGSVTDAGWEACAQTSHRRG